MPACLHGCGKNRPEERFGADAAEVHTRVLASTGEGKQGRDLNDKAQLLGGQLPQ